MLRYRVRGCGFALPSGATTCSRYLRLARQPLVAPSCGHFAVPSFLCLPTRGIASGTTNGIKWFDSSVRNIYHSGSACGHHWVYTTLGTMSAVASPLRGVSAGVLQLPGGTSYLFDAGEGTGAKLRESRAGNSADRFGAIFITHLHGDHCHGLPTVLHNLYSPVSSVRSVLKHRTREPAYSDSDGNLLSLGTNNRLAERAEARLKIFGPEGLYSFLYNAFAMTLNPRGLRDLPFDIYELQPHPSEGFFKNRSPLYAPTPSNGAVRGSEDVPTLGRRHKIYPDENGYYNLIDEADHTVRAGPIKHTVPCYGYVVEGKAKRHILPEKLAERGIPPSPLIAQLQREGSIISPKDGSVVKLEDVSAVPSTPPTKVVILGDTCNPYKLQPIAQGADLLVHENTLGEDPDRIAAVRKGHSNAEMAGEFARAIGAKRLLLTHFGVRPGHEGLIACLSYMGLQQIRQALEAGVKKWLEECTSSGGSSSGSGSISEAVARNIKRGFPPFSQNRLQPLEHILSRVKGPISKDLAEFAVDMCAPWSHHWAVDPMGIVSVHKAIARGIFETRRLETEPHSSKELGQVNISAFTTTVEENVREALLRATQRVRTASNYDVELSDYTYPVIPEIHDVIPIQKAAKKGLGSSSNTCNVLCARDYMSVVVDRVSRDEALSAVADSAATGSGSGEKKKRNTVLAIDKGKWVEKKTDERKEKRAAEVAAGKRRMEEQQGKQQRDNLLTKW
jgi:ribonuclease Z